MSGVQINNTETNKHFYFLTEDDVDAQMVYVFCEKCDKMFLNTTIE